MVKAVIFDLDDTLISEKEYIISGYRHISGVLNKEYHINEAKVFIELMKLFDLNPNNVFNRLLDQYEIDYTEELIIGLVNEYRNHMPEISFYDDVEPCLKHLRAEGIKTGIITDGYASAQRQKLHAVKAYNYFDEIILTDELGREYWKPHPRAFEVMKERLNCEFDEMVYIGDNPEKDFYIGKIYPVKTIRISRDKSEYDLVYQCKEYLGGIEEDYKITKLERLFDLI